MRKLYLSVLIATLCATVYAQRTDSITTKTSASSLQASLDFGYGQALAKNQSDYKSALYTAPGLSYVHNTGLGLSASAYYFLGSVSGSRAYELDITASYDNIKSDFFSYGLAYTAYLFNKNSTIPKTPIKNDLYAYFSYDAFYLNPEIAFDYGFGSITTAAKVLNGKRRQVTIAPQKISGEDIFMIIDISHEYYTSPSSNLSFTPKLFLITGTQNYYQNLQASQNFSRTRLQEIFNSANSDGATFKPRYVEASLKADYALGKLDIMPRYTLTLPISGTDRQAYGYFTGSLVYTFK